MSTLQSIVASLLFDTGAGRAILQIVTADGLLVPVAEAVTQGLRPPRR